MTVKRRAHLVCWFGVLLLVGCVTAANHAAEDIRSPTIKTLLSLPQVDAPALSADGNTIAYTLTVPDWDANRYDTEIHLASAGGTPRQLTHNAQGSSHSPQWAPKGGYLGYLANQGSGDQIFRLQVDTDEAQPVTAWPGGVLSFRWSPSGTHIALLTVIPLGLDNTDRAATFGQFEVLGETQLVAGLWLVDVEAAIAQGGAGPDSSAVRALTPPDQFSVSVFSADGLRANYAFSPDGTHMVFSHGKSLAIVDSIQANVSSVELATGKITPLVESEHWDETPVYSPDGRQILFTRVVLEDWLADRQFLVVPSSGQGAVKRLALQVDDARDRQLKLVDWLESGIVSLNQTGTRQRILMVDPATGSASSDLEDGMTITDVAVTADGASYAYVAFDAQLAPELFWQRRSGSAKRVTDLARTIDAWSVYPHKVMRWKTEGGMDVEGILYSPPSQPSDAAAPLIIVLHGGPREAAFPRRVHNQLYPVQQWLDRGARVLFPNYRGSTGYGAALRKGSLGNIGKAESADVLAAVEVLQKRGMIQGDRVGVAGHSWGGYLAAFLATNTDRFAAASVGSGITDNRINYVLSAAGVAKEGYLASYPWTHQSLWDETSPIHYVAQASTPTLIQHGDRDRVVPTANARLLYRGLQDMGVPVKAVIFSDTGHYVERPREKRAWMQQNLDWFDQYLFAREE